MTSQPAALRHRAGSRWLVAPLTVAGLGLTGCGTAVQSASSTAEASSSHHYPVTVQNCGREIRVEAAPERVVGLSPSQTELLVRLGLSDRLVGQAQTETHQLPADVVAEVADVPTLSTTVPPNREALLKVRPDAVVAPTTYEFTAAQGFASMAQLRQAGVISYVAVGGCPQRRNTATVNDLFADIAALGQMFDVPHTAHRLIMNGKQRLQAVDEAIAGKPKPTVAELYIEGNSVSAIGAGIEYDIIRRAGGNNVFSPNEELFDEFFSAVVSPEEIAARNPDAIVFGVTDAKHETRVRNYLHRTFPHVRAVAENRLIAIPARDMFPGALGNISAVEKIAAELYPSEF